MTYEDLIRSASRYYPDDLVFFTYETGQQQGDTLALFIVRELFACDQEKPDDPLSVAVSRLETAINELTAVAEGLAEEREQWLEATGSESRYHVS